VRFAQAADHLRRRLAQVCAHFTDADLDRLTTDMTRLRWKYELKELREPVT
jgi:hypothetical protein